jgi:hypothetical protein
LLFHRHSEIQLDLEKVRQKIGNAIACGGNIHSLHIFYIIKYSLSFLVQQKKQFDILMEHLSEERIADIVNGIYRYKKFTFHKTNKFIFRSKEKYK